MRRDHTAETRAARSLVLSGSLERRITQLKRLLPPLESRVWMPVGVLDVSPAVHALLADARRHAKARRYLAATKAYQTAEDIRNANGPSIREARRRAEAERLQEKRRADAIRGAATTNAERRRVGQPLAAAYVERAQEMRRRTPNRELRAIANVLIQHPKGLMPRSVRQLLRDFDAAGLK